MSSVALPLLTISGMPATTMPIQVGKDDAAVVHAAQVSLSGQFIYARMHWNVWHRPVDSVHASQLEMTSEGWPPFKRQRTSDRITTIKPSTFSKLPTEIVEQIMLCLPFLELVKLRQINKAFNGMLSQPRMYPHIAMSADKTLKPLFVNGLARILPATQSLTLRSFSLGHLGLLLPNLTDCLTSLDLSFSTVTDDLLSTVAFDGALQRVKHLRLKACRGVHDVALLASDLPELESLDLSWSGVATLPTTCGNADEDATLNDFESPDSDDSGFFDIIPSSKYSPNSKSPTPPPFQQLRHLSLSSVFCLSTSSLLEFLNDLPPTLQTIDLSYLALTRTTLASVVLPAKLRLDSIDLTGNDRLTMVDITHLERQWGDKVARIEHGPLLESEEEDDVRRFVQMLARIHS
ncbi:hypothetical protein OIV83_003140 [Microbotryomycetes sp. JL201]|nr:hypothetical protein OIV83_003140 [Microbotryomycetes sp. JL201]